MASKDSLTRNRPEDFCLVDREITSSRLFFIPFCLGHSPKNVFGRTLRQPYCDTTGYESCSGPSRTCLPVLDRGRYLVNILDRIRLFMMSILYHWMI